MRVEDVCLHCGACCAHYRVAFHWLEAHHADSVPVHNPVPNPVPMELTEPLDAHRLVMRGTRDRPARCVALEGEIGGCVRCTIYPARPSPCRDLQPSWADGAPNDQCDRARAAWGLRPLQPADLIAPDELPAPVREFIFPGELDPDRTPDGDSPLPDAA